MINLKNIFIGFIIIATVVVGCLLAQQQQNRQQFLILSFHCNNINSDFTRPEKRMCTTPISFKDNVFIFATTGDKKERYLIIGINGGADDIRYNSFAYNFIDYIEE